MSTPAELFPVLMVILNRHEVLEEVFSGATLIHPEAWQRRTSAKTVTGYFSHQRALLHP